MTNDDTVALGELVQHLRDTKGMTQEDLGKRAGYGAGAGVSISRFENGQVRPGDDKLQAIAKALGTTREELAAQAAKRGTSRSIERLKDRDARITREAAAQTEALEAAGAAFDEAWNQARTGFLERFAEIASRIAGAEPPEHPQPAGSAEPKSVEGAAAWRQMEASTGFAETLVSSAATALLLDAWRRGPSLAGGFVGAARGLGIGAAIPALLLLATTAFSIVRASRKQQDERAKELDRAEAELAAAEPGLSALNALLPRATDILEYIAVHAGHALDRWERQLGDEPLGWNELDLAARERYFDFIQISGAQIVVKRIDFQRLPTLERGDLAAAVRDAHADLTRANDVVTTLV
jgi:transcriptional regulator with XRE-family HTH domain